MQQEAKEDLEVAISQVVGVWDEEMEPDHLKLPVNSVEDLVEPRVINEIFIRAEQENKEHTGGGSICALDLP